MDRLGKLMTMLNPEKTRMVSAEEALPGRSEPGFAVPETHAVLGTPINSPSPFRPSMQGDMVRATLGKSA